MHILIATDARWIADEVSAALGGPDTGFTVVSEGRSVIPAIKERHPDLAILDLQIGTMGGMAITLQLRNDESIGAVSPTVPVLMLLDRAADLFLAQRSSADGWLIKPLDARRIEKAAAAILRGEKYFEGLPEPEVAADGDDDEVADTADTAEEVPAPAG